MRPHEIESWALGIIDRVKSHQPIEDSRVELKSGWIETDKAARRIAAHANAARGAPILWLVGVDEDNGVMGVAVERFADWYSTVSAQFDGLAPRVTDINVPVGNTTVVTLLFDTDRAPYVVKNPVYGTKGGGPVQFEVPWREGTATRSATRSDLLKLLSPLQSMPTFEVLEGTLVVKRPSGQDAELQLHWVLTLVLYAETSLDIPVVIPFHRSYAEFTVVNQVDWTRFEWLSLQPPRSTGSRSQGPSRLMSLTIDATDEEVIIGGPGKVRLTAQVSTTAYQLRDGPAEVAVVLMPVGADHPLVIRASLDQSTQAQKDSLPIWLFAAPTTG